MILTTSIFCSLLVLFGFIISPGTLEVNKALINRGGSLLILWITYFLGVKSLKSKELEKIKLDNERLINVLEGQKRSLDAATLISETNREGVITYVNSKFCEFSGYSKKELLGKTHRMVKSEEHSAEFWKKCWETIKSGETFKNEVCNKSKDGKPYWVEATIMPRFDDKKKIIGYSSVRVDITAKKIQMKINEHQSRLAFIGEMAAGVGHEINNPLSISIGNIASIEKDIKNDGHNRILLFEKLEKIKDGHERIRKIVDGLRTYSRSDSDHDEVISMQRTITQTVNLIFEIYDKEGIHIVEKKPSTEIFTKGNLGKLQQVIMNLISNAKDATEGLEKRYITLTLKKKNENQFIFSVADTGTGIPDNIKDKILNPFFTTKAIGKGTGIGLGIVSEIVKSMNGKMEIESILGEGSTFSIILPLEDHTSSRKEKEEEKELAPLKGSALVVDDEKRIRELLVEHLEDLGLLVEEADDGDTALEMVKLKKYDYICTDMKMKRMQGDEFIKKARNLSSGDTKIFIITGGVTTNYSEDKKIELRDIADGYIQKPFTEKSIRKELSK